MIPRPRRHAVRSDQNFSRGSGPGHGQRFGRRESPIDGVIAGVAVHPNQMVQAGTALFRYEDTNLRNQFLVAEKQLTVAMAEQTQSIQAGFGDPQRKAEVPLKEAKSIFARPSCNMHQGNAGSGRSHRPTSGLAALFRQV